MCTMTSPKIKKTIKIHIILYYNKQEGHTTGCVDFEYGLCWDETI